jgi:hypothetical protein
MKRSIFILLAVLLSAALMLGGAMTANAKATRIEVNSFEYDCGNGWEKDWMEGNVWHIRNYVHTNRNVSDFPELEGVNTTVADAEINFATGYVAIRGSLSWKPDTIDGTWEGSWIFISNAGVTRGYSVAHGTGELAGKTLFLNLYDPPNPYTPEVGEVMCAGLGEYEANTYAEGYILESVVPKRVPIDSE